MRNWLVSLVALALIWQLIKYNEVDKLESRVVAAIALTADCNIDEASDALDELRSLNASDAQIRRLKKALSKTTPACEKEQQREQAWDKAQSAINTALKADAFAKAGTLLAAFTRRWGVDANTEELKNKLEVRQAQAQLDLADTCLNQGKFSCTEQRLHTAERGKHPELARRISQMRERLSQLKQAQEAEKAQAAQLAKAAQLARQAQQKPPPITRSTPAPTSTPTSTAASQRAREMIRAAERSLEQGNFKGAADKMDICITMIDIGNPECRKLKQRAERMNTAMLRCVASGAEWRNDQCQ
jgi:hypothetical protein